MRTPTEIIPAEFDPPSGKSVGLIVMSSDEAGENAFKSLMPDSVRVFTTRAAYDEEQYLAGQFVPVGGFEGLAMCLPPELDLVAFSCTSAAISKGIETVSSEIAAGFPGIPSTNPALALREMLARMGAANIGFLSPYPLSMQRFFLDFFQKNDVCVTASATFAIASDPDYKRLRPSSLINGIEYLNKDIDNDLNFISCTAIDVVPHLPLLNREGSPPVFSSSQFFAAHALMLLGLTDAAERALAISTPRRVMAELASETLDRVGMIS